MLLQLSFEGDPELDSAGVPTLAHVLKSEIQRQLGAIVFGGVAMSRPFATPPGLPADRLAALRAGLKAAAADSAMPGGRPTDRQSGDLCRARAYCRGDATGLFHQT